jgi:Putative mono-oxygenase ydhR
LGAIGLHPACNPARVAIDAKGKRMPARHDIIITADSFREIAMLVAIVTFRLPQPITLDEITKTFQSTAPKYRGLPGLLRKNYWLSEDGRRAGGIYVWETRADADRLYTAEWKKFVEDKYGSPATIEYLHSPVMVDNRDGAITVAA